MMTVIAIMLLFIFGLPFIGMKVATTPGNRGLGIAIIIVGIIIWLIIDAKYY